MKKIKLYTTILFVVLFSFTVKSQLTLPYYTGFDSPAEKAGWQQFRTGFLSTYSWDYGGSAFSAPDCLSHDYNVGGNSSDTVIDWFVSPPLNFTSYGKITMKVKTGGFSTPFPDGFEIWFGTGNPNPANGNFVLIANLSFMQPQYQWLDTTVNISFVSDSGYIALKYKTIGAAWSTYDIDNISVTLTPTYINETDNLRRTAVMIFPNPFITNATVFINDDQLITSPVEIRIYDLIGQETMRINEIRTKEIQITRGAMKNGLYFIKAIRDGIVIDCKKTMIE